MIKKLFISLYLLNFTATHLLAATAEVKVYDRNGNLIATETVELPPPDPVETAKVSDKSEYSTHVFKNMTPAEADAWIQANVTDLASAKIALRRMARVLMYLVRRSDL